MKKLRDRMLVDLQLRGAKPNTQKNYLREVDNLAKYFNRSPEDLGEAEIKEYLLYLMKERHLSIRGDIPILCCCPQILIQNDTETRMDGGEDKVSQGQDKTSYSSGSVRGGIPLRGHDESQTQGDLDAHLLIGTSGK